MGEYRRLEDLVVYQKLRRLHIDIESIFGGWTAWNAPWKRNCPNPIVAGLIHP